MAKTCPSCRFQAEDRDNFCGNCGASFSSSIQNRNLPTTAIEFGGHTQQWIDKFQEENYKLLEAANKNSATWDMWGKHLAAHRVNLKSNVLAEQLIELKQKAIIKYGEQKLNQMLALDQANFEAAFLLPIKSNNEYAKKRIDLLNDVKLYEQGLVGLDQVLSSDAFNSLSEEEKAILFLRIHEELLRRVFGNMRPGLTSNNDFNR